MDNNLVTAKHLTETRNAIQKWRETHHRGADINEDPKELIETILEAEKMKQTLKIKLNTNTNCESTIGTGGDTHQCGYKKNDQQITLHLVGAPDITNPITHIEDIIKIYNTKESIENTYHTYNDKIHHGHNITRKNKIETWPEIMTIMIIQDPINKNIISAPRQIITDTGEHYTLKAMAKHTPGHWTCTVETNSKWHICNDSEISITSSPSIDCGNWYFYTKTENTEEHTQETGDTHSAESEHTKTKARKENDKEGKGTKDNKRNTQTIKRKRKRTITIEDTKTTEEMNRTKYKKTSKHITLTLEKIKQKQKKSEEKQTQTKTKKTHKRKTKETENKNQNAEGKKSKQTPKTELWKYIKYSLKETFS